MKFFWFRSGIFLALIFAFAVRQSQCQFTPSLAFSTRVLYSFRQGETGNCASISIVKASIATFGLSNANGVFKEDQVVDGIHHIILRNGQHVDVTSEEIALASTSGKFGPISDTKPIDPEIFSEANLIYAVMAKRAFELSQTPGSIFGITSRHWWSFFRSRYYPQANYASALDMLGDGRDADQLPVLLGIGSKEMSPSEVDQVAYIQTNHWHAVFAILDQYDEMGTEKPTTQLDSNHEACRLGICLHKGELDAFYLVPFETPLPQQTN